jgi:hypothetical protein
VIERERDSGHIPLRDVGSMLEKGLLSREQAEIVFRKASDWYQGGNVLTGEEQAALADLRARLTDFINPYPVEELDKKVAELDAKFPDWEHWYRRAGTNITWMSRPRSPDHPLAYYYSGVRGKDDSGAR